MSKQSRAAKAIKFGAARGYTPEQTATLLNELNLLAPDLPEPRTFPETGEYEWHMKDGYVNLHGGEITVSYDERDEDTYPTDPAPELGEIRITRTGQGRAVAYAILTACDLKDAHDD